MSDHTDRLHDAIRYHPIYRATTTAFAIGLSALGGLVVLHHHVRKAFDAKR